MSDSNNGNGSAREPDAIVVGAGLAGLVSTLELLRSGHTVLLLDRCHPHELGGLAREAFGGMFMVDSPEQRRSRIRDSERLALEDWLRIAELGSEERWPRLWAEQYVARARDDVGGWLRELGVRFFPVVNWAERGNFGDGNSVPRFHLTWGTGKALVQAVWGAIESHPRRGALEVRFGARVNELIADGQGRVVGCRVVDEDWRGGREGARGSRRVRPPGAPTDRGLRDRRAAGYEARAGKAVVIAAGGIGGNPELVRRVWPTAELGSPPGRLLMGSHPYADGAMHEEVERVGGAVTHLSRMWNYADAVRHPTPAAPRPRREADPATLRGDARPRRPPLRPRAGDADLRRVRGAGADVRGRAQVLVADLQLEDRAARARRVRLPAQPPPARAPPRCASCSGVLLGKPRVVSPPAGGLARLRLRPTRCPSSRAR